LTQGEPSTERLSAAAVFAAPQGIVFDLDDTLYPERQYAWGGFEAVARAFADRLGDAAGNLARMRRLLDSKDRGRVFDALLDELAIADRGDLVSRMVEVYRGTRPRIALFEGTEEVLAELRRGYRLGLLTDPPSGGPSIQWTKIEVLGIRCYFHAIVVTSELGADCGKPSARPFEVLAERMQVEANRLVYVADNPRKDFLAPNALGWRTVQVLRPDGLYARETPPPGGAAQHVIAALGQLPALVRGWAAGGT
jgi:putative hydrolase of the HAD superfamily